MELGIVVSRKHLGSDLAVNSLLCCYSSIFEGVGSGALGASRRNSP